MGACEYHDRLINILTPAFKLGRIRQAAKLGFSPELNVRAKALITFAHYPGINAGASR